MSFFFSAFKYLFSGHYSSSSHHSGGWGGGWRDDKHSWRDKYNWTKEPVEGVSYHDIVDGTNIEAGCGDDKFIIRSFEGCARVDGNRGYDVLDLGDLNPNNYILKQYSWGCGDKESFYGKVILLDDEGNKIGVVKFSGIEEIDQTVRPNGIVEGTSGDDLIDLNFVDYNGDRIDANDALNIPVVGSNNDIIRAGAGDDTVFGLEEFDQIRGGEGNDELYGGGAGDLMFGDEGDDFVNGEDGDDNMQGNTGNDTLVGEEGDDQIYGGLGDDIVNGGAGDDVLYGEGLDRFQGDQGSDTFVFGIDDGTDQVWDFVSGVDFVSLEGYVAGTNDPTFDVRGDHTFMTYEDTTVIFRFAEVGLDDLTI